MGVYFSMLASIYRWIAPYELRVSLKKCMHAFLDQR